MGLLRETRHLPVVRLCLQNDVALHKPVLPLLNSLLTPSLKCSFEQTLISHLTGSPASTADGSAKSRNNMKNRGIDEKILFIFSKTLMLNQNMLILEALWVCVTCIYVIHFNLNHNFHFRSENILMAHERIEVDLPLAKVYELLNNPVHYTKFLERIDTIEKVNSQTFTYITEIGGEEFRWTTNIIDNLRNTRVAWITINGNLNQTGTIRFTPLDNGERTRVDFSLDYRTFFGEADEELAKFIEELPDQLAKDLQTFKKLAETDTFKDEEQAEKPSEVTT
mgnify:CR=1 FL=1